MITIFVNVALLCYATEREEYKTQVDEEGIVVLDTVDSKISVNFIDENNIELDYSKSYINDNKIKNIYFDNNDNEYIICNDECVGFIRKFSVDTIVHSNAKLNKDALETKAYEFMKEVIINSSRLNDYVLTSYGYVESYSEYVYTFTKKIDEYRTNDFICISLDGYGNLASFCGSHQGDFDSLRNIDICQDDIDEFIENNICEKYGSVQYEISSCFINKIDDKFVMQYNINIYNDEDDCNSEILLYPL